MTDTNQYAERDPMELDRDGGYYCRHVSAMTAEGLHKKSDIAAELAWRDREIDKLRSALSARASAGEGGEYVLLPRRLTAENGAKGLLSGEFCEHFEFKCYECDDGMIDDKPCDDCDGRGTHRVKVPVEWTTIKAIHRMVVEHLATAAPQPAKVEGMQSIGGFDEYEAARTSQPAAAQGGDGFPPAYEDYVAALAAAPQPPQNQCDGCRAGDVADAEGFHRYPHMLCQKGRYTTPPAHGDGEGWIITCWDDMCQGTGHCIHDDGEEICPECFGEGDFEDEAFEDFDDD